MSQTYHAVATRSGDWWAIEVVSGLPTDMLGVSQARRLGEVPEIARSLIAELLEVEPARIDVTLGLVLTPELQDAVDRFHYAAVVEAAARTEAAKARSRAAAALLAAKLTMREAAEVLGISHQRIKQLVDRAPDAENVDLLAAIETAVRDS
ncbi:MAG: hypothetical protein BMS9Abin07_2295 [Acidimicrobiia bacterium]|nr:MAG: hypothetical protein BMS9Abin07_2295 [Acidimicrobiia bacterium]